MTPRQHPLSPPAELFAAHAHRTSSPTTGLEAMALALRLGATGIATTAQITRDDTIVLHRTPTIGSLRKRRIDETDHAQLPDVIPTLTEVHLGLGVDTPLLIEVSGEHLARRVLELSMLAGADDRLILCSVDWTALAEVKNAVPSRAIFAHTTAPNLLEGSTERHAAQLRDLGIDALAMSHEHWNGGTVALLHRFRRFCIATGAEHERMIERVLHIGADAVVGDHADRLHDAAAPYR